MPPKSSQGDQGSTADYREEFLLNKHDLVLAKISETRDVDQCSLSKDRASNHRSADICQLIALVQPWRDEVVRPLRVARRFLKTTTWKTSETDSLRKRIQEQKLGAERLQQLFLEARLDPLAVCVWGETVTITDEIRALPGQTAQAIQMQFFAKADSLGDHRGIAQLRHYRRRNLDVQAFQLRQGLRPAAPRNALINALSNRPPRKMAARLKFWPEILQPVGVNRAIRS
jgi:hypothetical protein